MNQTTRVRKEETGLLRSRFMPPETCLEARAGRR